jgi:hypothetical protein
MSLDSEKQIMQGIFFVGTHIEEEEKATAMRTTLTQGSTECASTPHPPQQEKSPR